MGMLGLRSQIIKEEDQTMELRKQLFSIVLIKFLSKSIFTLIAVFVSINTYSHGGSSSGDRWPAPSPVLEPLEEIKQMPVIKSNHNKRSPSSVGKPGKNRSVDFTVDIVLVDGADNHVVAPGNFTEVEVGDVVRFKVRNAGHELHELFIGTHSERREHKKAILKTQPEPGIQGYNSIIVAPGETAELNWKFDAKNAEVVLFSCNLPGHYDSGQYVEATIRLRRGFFW